MKSTHFNYVRGGLHLPELCRCSTFEAKVLVKLLTGFFRMRLTMELQKPLPSKSAQYRLDRAKSRPERCRKNIERQEVSDAWIDSCGGKEMNPS